MEIENRIKAVLHKVLMLSNDRITPDALLIEDFGMTSLDRFELLMALEEEFSIELPEQPQESIRTVGDLVQYVAVQTKAA